MIYHVISCVLAVAATIYGVVSLFRKGKAMYFQLIVCAAACFSLKELWIVVNLLSQSVQGENGIQLFGLFGCYCFLLSANFGTFDRIVDETKGKSHTRATLLGLLAPMCLLVLYLVGAMTSKDHRFLLLIISIPTFVSSYYNFNHLLLPLDEIGLLKATRPIDVMSLVFFGFESVFTFSSLNEIPVLAGICGIVSAGIVVSLVILSVKGAKQWGTLI